MTYAPHNAVSASSVSKATQLHRRRQWNGLVVNLNIDKTDGV
jgi:hypothetical protein